MRLPKQPPHLSRQIIGKIFPALTKPEVTAFVKAANARYFHWDELRHRTPPAGLTPEQSWALVKLARSGQRRFLPMRDVSGRPFSYWLPPHAMATLHVVDRGAGTMALDGSLAHALEPVRDQVLVSSLMEEAIATSQIEGAVTTRKVAKAMLRAKRKPRNSSEQMIVNSYLTMQLLRARKSEPLSVDFLLEIQESMTRETLEDPGGVGRLRVADDDVAVVDSRDESIVFTPPPAAMLKTRLSALVEFANAPPDEEDFIHPLVKAAILHFWLAYEHPFVDGNGRTARALLYWFMLKQGYWLFEFLTVSRAIARSRGAYYKSFLYSEHDGEDATYSLLYQLNATRDAIDTLRGYLAKKQEEQRQVARTLRTLPELNQRQRTLLDYLMKHPDEVVTFNTHRTTHDITYVTARSDILGLLERARLTETKVGKQRAFFAADGLAESLAKAAQARQP